MQVEVWMDVVCPWCYIGRRRFEQALELHPRRVEVEVLYRSFELDPGATSDSSRSLDELLASKYGVTPAEAAAANRHVAELAAQEGLEFHLEKAHPTNTLDAHRLLQLARVRRIRSAVEERFQRAYFCEGAAISDPTTLLRLGVEAGLKESDIRQVLGGQAFTLQVRNDEKEAREWGARGVPFFVFDRNLKIFGAQPKEAFQRALSAGTQLRNVL